MAISCTAMAYPRPDVVWLFDDMTFSTDNALLSVNTMPLDEFTVASTLTIANLNFLNFGNYSCEAHNGLEPVDTADIQLHLHCECAMIMHFVSWLLQTAVMKYYNMHRSS